MEEIKIIRPKFEDGVLLTTERIDALSQQSFKFNDYLYQDYSDGIISGFKISVEDKNIIIKNGLFKYQNKVFLLNKTISIYCQPTDILTYLKISFKESIKKLGEVTYYFEIGLSEDNLLETDIELCRFRLQKGAKLRYIYDGFDDMITEFDTINLINCPYVAKKKPSLHPIILNRFATELIASGTKNIIDQNFCINILNQNNGICLDSICAYLKFRNNIEFDKISNIKIYKSLNEILLSEKNKINEIHKKPIKKRMILID